MRTPKAPKRVELNPSNHEIILDADCPDIEDGIANVEFKLAENSGYICVNKKEAARIGKWFTDLSKALK